ncbi:hypothetical protein [Photobacterium leiognathi]|uniref:hypothetical protein n=1 Tax=Photobacterium leiognathi TaxID=553611 RepID=UPI00387E6FFA
MVKFLWLILQHVLPKGFRRVRYVLLRGHNKKQLKAIQFMFMLAGQLMLPLLPTCHAINGNISPQITDAQ